MLKAKRDSGAYKFLAVGTVPLIYAKGASHSSIRLTVMTIGPLHLVRDAMVLPAGGTMHYGSRG